MIYFYTLASIWYTSFYKSEKFSGKIYHHGVRKYGEHLLIKWTQGPNRVRNRSRTLVPTHWLSYRPSSKNLKTCKPRTWCFMFVAMLCNLCCGVMCHQVLLHDLEIYPIVFFIPYLRYHPRLWSFCNLI